MHPAALHRDTWKPYNHEPVIYDGVACCIYGDEFGDGEIRVEFIPEDENEDERWPLDVLLLPKAKQQAILDQLR